LLGNVSEIENTARDTTQNKREKEKKNEESITDTSELNENENIAKLWGPLMKYLRKFVTLNLHFSKRNLQINDLSFHLTKLKRDQIKSKLSRKKKIIRVGLEI